jgi:hypothetical protein
MMEKRVHQRMFFIPCSRMNDDPGGLVQHHQIIVFIQDVQRDILRLRISRPRFRPVNSDRLSCSWGMRGLNQLTVYLNVPFVN